jgi:[FeFe] hydrogenase H-cluster maturation GTPase HydF
MDTAGFGDHGELGAKRKQKTLQALKQADVAVLILDQDKIETFEEEIIAELNKEKIPFLKVYNKADTKNITATDGIKVNSTDTSSRDKVLSLLKEELCKICPDNFLANPPMLGDLATPKSTIMMIIPIDYEAPKGRLILPQVQAIRDCLDHNQNIMIVKQDNYLQALNNLKVPPSLVVCDSQVVDLMVAQTPAHIRCTTFSILMARLKGDLAKMIQGAMLVRTLKDHDKILIAESCTHHPLNDDIGRIKIPNLLRQKTKKELDIDFVSGCDFASDLSKYKLVVHCGGCTINRKEMLCRINSCTNAGVGITNYGVLISELKGVLNRVIEPFDNIILP